ncbi:MAG: hypothetical protein LBN43_03630 [Oscillospiraceae bacterium]|jgi:hypothetical protein|nr:hypothetical protein [Oscillospiraceae bacterium]
METNFDLGVELAGLLSSNANGGASDSGDFAAFISALRVYLSPEQNARLSRALELAELIKSAKQILPRLGGALGVQ